MDSGIRPYYNVVTINDPAEISLDGKKSWVMSDTVKINVRYTADK